MKERTVTGWVNLSHDARERIETVIKHRGLICNGGSCIQMSDGSKMLSISVCCFDGRPVDSTTQIKNEIVRIFEEEGILSCDAVLN